MAALSIMEMAPLRTPLAVGVKVTVMVQFPEASTVVQLLVCEKSPLAATLPTVSELFPIFVTVTVCVGLDTPTLRLPKFRATAENAGPVGAVIVIVPELPADIAIFAPLTELPAPSSPEGKLKV